MKKLYVANAFSLSMLDRHDQQYMVENTRIPFPCNNPLNYLKNCKENNIEIVSCIGHENTAQLFSNILGMQLSANRIDIKLEKDIILLVGQYQGPRLEEGVTTLPENAKIDWWLI